LNADFTPCWEIHDVLEAVSGSPLGSIDEEKIGKRIIAEYGKIISCLSSDTGRLKLARMRSPYNGEWIEERKRERGPTAQAEFAARIEGERNNDRRHYRDWAIIGVLLAAWAGLLVYCRLFWHA
jgi:hypothetical protein